MKVCRSVIVLLLLLGSQFGARVWARCVILNKLRSIKEQICYKNSTYIIKNTFDLKGESLVVPDNCCLYFRGGQIKNGTIKGADTSVKSERRLIFDNVKVSGTWENDTVYSEWLNFISGPSFDNKDVFQNLMTLSNGVVLTHLYMQKGTYYCSVVKESSYIKVPSNVYWHNKATICQLKTDLQRYAFVLIGRSSNVTIDGGSFIGDVKSHIEKGGEWGHGIKIAGSTNVTLKNLSCNEFWGDGVDLIEGGFNKSIRAGITSCRNIVIDNVKCLRNRRTGLSIEAAINVIIRKSEFAYTGAIKMTAPGDGLGIEPWCKNEQKVYGILVENCNIHENKGGRDLSIQPNIQYYYKDENPKHHPKSNITIKSSRVGNLYVLFSNQLRIENCIVDDIVRYGCSDDVIIKNSQIKKQSDKRNKKGLTITHSR